MLNLVQIFGHIKFVLKFFLQNFHFEGFSRTFFEKICFVKRNKQKIMHFGGILTDGKMFRELTDPDPDLSLPGPGSNFSDPWQL